MVVLALVVFTVLGWLWGEGGLWANWRGAGADAGPLEVVKVSLTTIGGIGGTGYLVIKYRERASAERAERAAELARKDIEQEKAEQKLLNAVQQLGSESPQVRIAGVYALANVADTYRGDYRQRVVDILCGYLRTQRGTWGKTTADADETTPTKAYVSNDGAVESTVLEVLGRHLRKRHERTGAHDAVTQDVDDDQLWCDCVIDIHDAVIAEQASLNHLSFDKEVNFQGTNFLDVADFTRTTFGYADFSGSHFWRPALLEDTTFLDSAIFSDCRFYSIAVFRRSIFHCYTQLDCVRFIGDAHFWDVTFLEGVDFGSSEFMKTSNFCSTTFLGYTSFFLTKIFHANFLTALFVGYVDSRGSEIQDPDFSYACFNVCTVHSTPIFPPVETKTGLPPGALWAILDGAGNVIKRFPAGRPAPDDEPDDVS